MGCQVADITVRSQGTWRCEGPTGTKFEVVLENGEWVDYDEKVCYITKCIGAATHPNVCQAAMPVGVSDIESQWSRA